MKSNEGCSGASGSGDCEREFWVECRRKNRGGRSVGKLEREGEGCCMRRQSRETGELGGFYVQLMREEQRELSPGEWRRAGEFGRRNKSWSAAARLQLREVRTGEEDKGSRQGRVRLVAVGRRGRERTGRLRRLGVSTLNGSSALQSEVRQELRAREEGDEDSGQKKRGRSIGEKKD